MFRAIPRMLHGRELLCLLPSLSLDRGLHYIGSVFKTNDEHPSTTCRVSPLVRSKGHKVRSISG